ncbi:MAG: tautomerase family protein [Ardenticatenaceae bacterium]|nr:tautomerase family protein [Ardenticatenaceae bacterium]
MPFSRIDLHEGKSESYIQAISDGLHEALQACFNVPERDRFQIISEHKPGRIIYDDYFDVNHSDAFVLIQITMGSGRSQAQKRAFFKRLAENLARSPGLRPEDLFIVLSENALENWSFGNGEAHCLTVPREMWR